MINKAKDTYKTQFLYICRLFVQSISNSPKYAGIVAAASLIATLKNLVAILMPPLLTGYLMTDTSIEKMIIAVVLYSFLLFIADSTSLGFQVLETSYGYTANNLASLRVGQKGMKVEYSTFEDASKLDSYQRARASTWIFSDMVDCTVGKLIPVIGGFVFSTYYIGQIGIVALVLVCVFAVLENWVLSVQKKAEYYIHTEIAGHERKKQYVNQLLCDLQYAKEIRIFDSLEYLLARKNEYEKNCLTLEKKKEVVILGYTVIRGMIRLFQLLIVYYASFEQLKAETFGPEVVFLVVASIQLFASSVQSLVAIYTDCVELGRYFMDYQLFMELSDEKKQGAAVSEPENESKVSIRFEDVSFRYPNAEGFALKNINFTIHEGEKIALVGENGSGKTTLVKLLCSLYSPSQGRIFVGNADLKTLDVEKYRKRIIPVFQDINLHEYSLRENISFDSMDDERIVRLMNEHGGGKMLSELPFGLNTYVTQELSENGRDFSGGERQYLTYIRALYKSETNKCANNLYLLDEPTAAIDPLAELEYAKDIVSSIGNSTAIYITHRLASVQNCDRILVLEGGEIQEFGSFSDLMKNKNGIFRKLYLTQAQMYL